MPNTPPPPTLDRPTFHVWYGSDPSDPEPEYRGVVAITNADQLTAEVQGRSKGLTDMKSQPMRVTNLWLWAAMVRMGWTEDRFDVFTNRVEYRPVKDTEEAPDPEGPTVGAEGPNTTSASSSRPSSEEDRPTGDSPTVPTTA